MPGSGSAHADLMDTRVAELVVGERFGASHSTS